MDCFAIGSSTAPQSRGVTGGPDPPSMKNNKNIGFLRNTSPDPLKNRKATKPANVGPSLARQRNATKMAFRWRADNDPP